MSTPGGVGRPRIGVARRPAAAPACPASHEDRQFTKRQFPQVYGWGFNLGLQLALRDGSGGPVFVERSAGVIPAAPGSRRFAGGGAAQGRLDVEGRRVISKSYLSALLIFPVIYLVGPAVADARTWRNATGTATVEAELVDFDAAKVWLRRSDGKVFAVGLGEISQADREYVKRRARRRAEEVAAAARGHASRLPYGPAREVCRLAGEAIGESSGLACSRARQGVFWTHNDSGDAARLYAFDIKGRDLGSCVLADVFAYDWEDIASFTLEQKHYLLIGDVGNNGLGAAVHLIYLIEEPEIHPVRGVVPRQVAVAQLIHFAYEDDHRNCEAVAVDPTRKTILLATKQSTMECHIYAMPWPQNDPKKVTVARKIATLKIPAATALDVSPDGRRAVVLTYGNAYEYVRGADEDWATAFARAGRMIAMPRREQGESICYGPDGRTLYLSSEGLGTPLWEVPVQGR